MYVVSLVCQIWVAILTQMHWTEGQAHALIMPFRWLQTSDHALPNSKLCEATATVAWLYKPLPLAITNYSIIDIIHNLLLQQQAWQQPLNTDSHDCCMAALALPAPSPSALRHEN